MPTRERKEWHLQGRVAADELRLALGLGTEAITDLWAFIDAQPDVDLAFHDFGNDADGLYRWNGRRGLIVINRRVHTFGRKRFTAAHELGHHVLHRDGELTEIFDANVYDDGGERKEVEANAFAAYFLAPDAAMKAAFPGRRPAQITVEDVVDLMIRYGLSFRTAAFRLHNAGRIQARDRDRLLQEAAGEIEWTLQAKSHGEDPIRATELPPRYLYEVLRSYRRGVIDAGRLGELLLTSPEEAVEQARRHAPAEREPPADEDLGGLGDMLRDAIKDTRPT